ncbi:MAG TPA: hypothetical protein VK254_00660 [Candidatus Bathyarchaeia archaeon]|nr:hypothetical protein [Candidatus Bathyarchaeia archaeon]
MLGKKVTVYLVILIILAAGFLVYRDWKNKKNQKANAPATVSETANKSASTTDSSDSADSDQASADFNAQCENGEWVKIADVQGDTSTVSGTLHWVDTDNDSASKEFQNYTHYLDGSEKIALVNPNAKADTDTNDLDLFQGREVEVQGVLKQGAAKEMQVAQVRCAGKETDKSVANNRVAMLNYVSANISSIAPEKAPHQKWAADSAIILDGKDVYVDYYDTIEDSDNADPNLDTMHRMLLEITPKGGENYDVKVLAYYVPGEDDFSLKQGTDKFKGQDETAFPSYTYDSEDNSWTRD